MCAGIQSGSAYQYQLGEKVSVIPFNCDGIIINKYGEFYLVSIPDLDNKWNATHENHVLCFHGDLRK